MQYENTFPIAGIWYTIETGTIDASGNEYVDDYVDSGKDQEGQLEAYIDIEFPALRALAEKQGTLVDGEVFFKRITAEKQDEDGYILATIELDYEREDAPHCPPLTSIASFGDIDATLAPLLD